ncbi:outer membrane beta-barrel protein [Nitrincola tapanii]|nr:outer membrane beta-barrel protein [Nitrincola tapanii]
MKTKMKRAILLAVSIAAANSAWALEPASFNLGPFAATPTLTLTHSYDDNFRANNDAESSSISQIEPGISLSAESNKSRYILSYSFVHDYFHSKSSLNNTDHFVAASADWEFDVRNRLNAYYDFAKTEDVADTNVPGVNDRFSNHNLGAGYVFGAPSARMNLEFGADHARKRTDNNVNFDKERNTDSIKGIFYYRVAPKTQLLTEVRRAEFDYRSNSALDSHNMTYLAGVRWEATAFTTGTAKIGRVKKDFKDSSKADKSSSSWEVNAIWQPLTYSTFNLGLNRGIDEGDDGADSIKTTRTSLDWTHNWSSFISTKVDLSHTDKDYDSINRSDTIKSAGFGVTYDLRRWMDITLGYQYTDKSSSLASESYDRNIYKLQLNVAL